MKRNVLSRISELKKEKFDSYDIHQLAVKLNLSNVSGLSGLSAQPEGIRPSRVISKSLEQPIPQSNIIM